MATFNGFTAQEIDDMDFAEIRRNLIVSDFSNKAPMAFLTWLTTTDHYYVGKLLTDEVRQAAENLTKFEYNYANADVDWRITFGAFLLEYIPVRLWISYGQDVASQLRKQAD